jgi:hypothetical protein
MRARTQCDLARRSDALDVTNEAEAMVQIEPA